MHMASLSFLIVVAHDLLAYSLICLLYLLCVHYFLYCCEDIELYRTYHRNLLVCSHTLHKTTDEPLLNIEFGT